MLRARGAGHGDLSQPTGCRAGRRTSWSCCARSPHRVDVSGCEGGEAVEKNVELQSQGDYVCVCTIFKKIS